MGKLGITMDERTYDVWITYDSMDLSFDFIEGVNADMNLLGGEILDTLGTKYSYEMRVVPNPNNLSDYDDFFYAISSPERIHSITLPFGQSTITFDAKINAGNHRFKGIQGQQKLWTGLRVSITPIDPQRVR